MSKKLCALVIGHKKSSPGASNKNSNLTEFDFNEDLSIRIENEVKDVDITRVYRTSYKNLPNEINALYPNFIISLHCNAFNRSASGTEVLYYHKSKSGKLMADVLQKHLLNCLGSNNRGTKPRTAEDRGGYLLRYTQAPCVISEPFFIDNDSDLSIAKANIVYLTGAYTVAIEEISKKI